MAGSPDDVDQWELDSQQLWDRCMNLAHPTLADFQHCFASTFSVCPVPLDEQDYGARHIIDEITANMPVAEQIKLFEWIASMDVFIQETLFAAWQDLPFDLLRTTLCTDAEIQQLLRWASETHEYTESVEDLMDFVYALRLDVPWDTVAAALQPFASQSLPLDWPLDLLAYEAMVHQLEIHSFEVFQQLRRSMALLMRCTDCIACGCLMQGDHKSQCRDCMCCRHVFDERVCRDDLHCGLQAAWRE